MRLIRVHTPGELRVAATTRIEGGAAAHLARVLRLRAGDLVTLFNGDGWDYPGVIVAIRGERVEVELRERVAGLPDSPLAITLVLGLARGEKMDLSVQKATELGVARIVPVTTERSVVRLDDEQGGRKLAHWRSVAISACEQCGRSRLPRIEAPLGLEAWLSGASVPARRLLLLPGAAVALGAIAAGPGELAVLVGPEGGLANSEVTAATRSGYEPRSLGPRILRAETAAMATIAILQAMSGDLR
jgi:16S rRNA (uracil1498-N3)-methyltransferase